MKETLKRLGKRLWEENTAFAQELVLALERSEAEHAARDALVEALGVEHASVEVRRSLVMTRREARSIDLLIELREREDETHVAVSATAHDPGVGSLRPKLPAAEAEALDALVEAVAAGLPGARPGTPRRGQGFLDPLRRDVVLGAPIHAAATLCLAATTAAGFRHDSIGTSGGAGVSRIPDPRRPRHGYGLSISLTEDEGALRARVAAISFPWPGRRSEDTQRMRAEVAAVAARLRELASR